MTGQQFLAKAEQILADQMGFEIDRSYFSSGSVSSVTFRVGPFRGVMLPHGGSHIRWGEEIQTSRLVPPGLVEPAEIIDWMLATLLSESLVVQRDLKRWPGGEYLLSKAPGGSSVVEGPSSAPAGAKAWVKGSPTGPGSFWVVTYDQGGYESKPVGCLVRKDYRADVSVDAVRKLSHRFLDGEISKEAFKEAHEAMLELTCILDHTAKWFRVAGFTNCVRHFKISEPPK
jgi:hypothetical protein